MMTAFKKYPVSFFLFSLILILLTPSCEKGNDLVPLRPERTVIVYMAARNNLSEYALNNISQMEQGLARKELNLLVYLNVPGQSPGVLKISPGGASETVISYPAHNAADPAVMGKVLSDIKEKYPADSYGLILWSHASSWMPPGTRPETLSFGEHQGDEMDIRELEEALPGKFEYIVFDACSMASVEVAYELREKADYLLASPTETIASGMPYHLVVNHFFEGREGLGKAAREYVEYYQQKEGDYRSATVSLLDCAELPQLAAATREVLENAHFDSDDYHRDEIQRLDFDNPPASEGYDFWDFFEKNLPAAELTSLKQQLGKTVLYSQHTSEFLGEPIEAFSGLSCYIPHQDDEFINNYYKTLDWSKASGFDLLIKD